MGIIKNGSVKKQMKDFTAGAIFPPFERGIWGF